MVNYSLPAPSSGALRVRRECDDELRTDSIFVPKGRVAKHARGVNVLTEPRFTASTERIAEYGDRFE